MLKACLEILKVQDSVILLGIEARMDVRLEISRDLLFASQM